MLQRKRGGLRVIYYYDHEFEYGENLEEHVTYLAESVATFINSLVEEEDDKDGEV